ncbi:D-glycero-beta-D-manno-heptose-7-phosphate kinase [Candidatus Poribacteria bacterium]|nr:D-glycero-beta-D-manno-heptose-7-phosphate kinase [Candidatus Poribacteria bacterium]
MDYRTLISQFNEKRILVIGDIIVDEYLWGEVKRISPEAPVPVFEMYGETIGCGGAANVAQNITSLGAKAELIGVIGKDRDGEKLLQMINSQNVDTSNISVDAQRPTSKKTRVVANIDQSGKEQQSIEKNTDKGHQLLRIDRESKQEINAMIKERLLGAVQSNLSDTDGIIFSDYDKGVVTKELIQSIIQYAQPYNIPIVADPKRNNFWKYEGVTSITPNHIEVGAAVENEISDVSHLIAAGEKILNRLRLNSLLITRDADGMTLFQFDSNKNLLVEHIPPQTSFVTDVTGAGDTVVAIFTLCLGTNGDFLSAAHLSSMAGGIVVGKMGCATVTKQELINSIPGL